MTDTRITWPPGHVIHMTTATDRGRFLSVATCDCGWRSRCLFGNRKKQDRWVERHWRQVEKQASP